MDKIKHYLKIKNIQSKTICGGWYFFFPFFLILASDFSADGDTSDAFEDVGHGTAARSIMNNYSIGVLEGSDPFLVGGYPQSLRTKDKKASSPITSLLQFLRPLLPVILLGMIWYYFSSKGKMPQSP